jgi:hypothetical protein
MDEAARRRAEALWDKAKQNRPKTVDAEEAARRAEAAKTARLRELRLAKEAEAQQARDESGRARRKPDPTK